MDIIDKKILCEMDLNCRMPVSQLAKKLRIGRNVADYRISNLEKEGVILKYICSVNLGMLGYRTYKIYFKLNYSENTDRFVKNIMEDKRVIHFLRTSGAFDYSTTLAVKTTAELDNFLTAIKNDFGKIIRDYSVSIVSHSKIFKLNKLLLGQKSEVKFEKYSSEEKNIKFDEKDKTILRELSQNANKSVVDIAENTGISLDSVKYRLKELGKNLSFRIMLNFDKLGYYHYVIMIKARRMSEKDEERLIFWCAFKQNVLYITKRIGSFDFEINAAITDINDFNNFISELQKEFGKNMDSYDILINSKLLKLNYIPF